jgi:hypothetical protein
MVAQETKNVNNRTASKRQKIEWQQPQLVRQYQHHPLMYTPQQPKNIN